MLIRSKDNIYIEITLQKLMVQNVQMPKKDYEDMVDYMKRMRETIEVLSNKETVKKLNSALNRVESGTFLIKDDMNT